MFKVAFILFSLLLCSAGFSLSLDIPGVATASINSFVTKFYDNKTNYLFDTFPNSNSLTGYWTFAQGFDTVLDAAYRISLNISTPNDSSLSFYTQLINNLYLGQQKIGWDRPFIDDMNWMALALLRAYELTNNKDYLNTCLYLKEKIGMKRVVATASNAGPALLFARLFKLLQNQDDLLFSEKVFNFWYNNMVNNTDYSVCDHISSEGVKQCNWRFTYNEGLMIGAGLELYSITKSMNYLKIINSIANFMITQEVVSTVYGKTLFDGLNCNGDCEQFKGIGFRYLYALYNLTLDKRYLDVLNSSINSIWNLSRRTTDDTFAVNWAGPPPNPQSSFNQAQMNSATMAINIYALLNKKYKR
ncbi:hypothetical protein ABK040_014723 [Willaertia magna]